ncbi:MAG: aminoglycoside phosphotransferase family protein [Candidatus Taylorbacteria bacterium]|nr:aminoglycoside phosphotransferase family protein [Candidatus Taylorbacteria bacterium]
MPEKIPLNVTFTEPQRVDIPLVRGSVAELKEAVEATSTRLLKMSHDSAPRLTRDAIEADFPDLKVENLSVIKYGDEALADDNTVVEVNDKIIFKFPTKGEALVDRERKFLQLIEGRLTAATPKVLHVGEKKCLYGTDKIEGIHLSGAWYEHASDTEKESLAADIVLFLRELHTKVPIAEAERIGVQEDAVDKVWPLERLQTVIDTQAGDDDGFKAFLTRAAEAYHKVPSREMEQKVFLHHDLSDGNLFLDPDTKRLKGVIDFGNVATGDKYIDFASLYRNRPEFGLHVARKYAELTGTAIDPERVMATAVVKQIVHLVQSPEKKRLSVEKLQQWYADSRE